MAPGKEGKTRQRVKLGLSDGALGRVETPVNILIDDRLYSSAEVTRVIAGGGGAGG